MNLTVLYNALTGKLTPASRAAPVSISIPAHDDDDTPVRPSAADLEKSADSVTGHNCIIEYIDSKGMASIRRISCVRVGASDIGLSHLYAWCHERSARRTFIIGKITQVIDAETGEAMGSGEDYFASLTAGSNLQGQQNWGLSAVDYADLIAGLNVLVFLARCDGSAHELEFDEIESFVISYWLRSELTHDFPEQDILTSIRRLAPDPEAFVIAIRRAKSHRILRPLLAGYTAKLVQADGLIHSKEIHWMQIAAQHFTE